jgi:malic enzyme
VTSAAVMAAMHAIGKESRDICSAKIVIAGAGSAGVGIAQSIRYAMSRFGLSEELASKQFWLTDNKGLLGRGRLASNRMQDNFIRTDFANEMSLLDVVKSVKPDILIGVTGVGGLFTKEIVEAMSEGCERPFLFPLSNPTANAECTAEQAFTWSKGKALYASGSPFDPVQIDGRTYYPNQANNMYTFPGIGLGAILCGAKIITENMLHAASLELSLQVSPRSLAEGKIFPEVSKIRDISLNVAVQVIRAAQDDGVSTKSLPRDLENLRRFVEEKMWLPSYGAVVYPYSQNWDGPRDGKFHL